MSHSSNAVWPSAGRRLTRKTPHAQTAYGPRKVTLAELRAAKARINITKKFERKQRVAENHQAWDVVVANVEASRALVDRFGWGGDRVSTECDRADPTHDFAIARKINTIYCNRCAARSSGGRLMGLGRACRGLQPGSRTALNLLLAGVLPKYGARMPAGMARRRRRHS